MAKIKIIVSIELRSFAKKDSGGSRRDKKSSSGKLNSRERRRNAEMTAPNCCTL
jgi:hypothetical protein